MVVRAPDVVGHLRLLFAIQGLNVQWELSVDALLLNGAIKLLNEGCLDLQ